MPKGIKGFQKGHTINKGRKLPHIGIPHTKEAKIKIGLASKERCSNPKYKKNLSEKQRKNLLGKTGKLARNWQGGIRKSGGYVFIFNPSHPRAYNSYVKRAILVMEKKIGRLLTKQEVVHHINEIKDDDRPENLQLFSSQREHKAYHLRDYANKRKNLCHR